MESKILDLILALFGILSFVWSFFSSENRVIAIIVGFALFILMFLSEQNQRIKEIISEHRRLEEKLKIHEQLIDMKAEIKNLKEKINCKKKRY